MHLSFDLKRDDKGRYSYVCPVIPEFAYPVPTDQVLPDGIMGNITDLTSAVNTCLERNYRVHGIAIPIDPTPLVTVERTRLLEPGEVFANVLSFVLDLTDQMLVNIHNFRVKHSVNMASIAEQCGTSTVMLDSILELTGTPNISHLMQIANAMGAHFSVQIHADKPA